jgi:hypothetical protein
MCSLILGANISYALVAKSRLLYGCLRLRCNSPLVSKRSRSAQWPFVQALLCFRQSEPNQAKGNSTIPELALIRQF